MASSLAVTGFIIIGRAGNSSVPAGIVVMRGDPATLAQAMRQTADEMANMLSQTGDQAMTAAELTLTAQAAAEVAQERDPTLGAFKFLGSTAFGTAVGIGVSPIITPVGGFVAGFFAGKMYDWLFDWVNSFSENANTYSSDLLSTWDMEGWGDISTTTNTLYDLSRTPEPPRVDPLVLDLDGDGIETVGIQPGAVVLFDHNADGIKTGSGWVKADDGILALDLDGNGQIETGRELFGDQTLVQSGANAGQRAANGLAALAQHDTHTDGRIDSADATTGMASGNTLQSSASFTRVDGSTGVSGDLLLANNNNYLYREDTYPQATAHRRRRLARTCHGLRTKNGISPRRMVIVCYQTESKRRGKDWRGLAPLAGGEQGGTCTVSRRGGGQELRFEEPKLESTIQSGALRS